MGFVPESRHFTTMNSTAVRPGKWVSCDRAYLTLLIFSRQSGQQMWKAVSPVPVW